MSEAITARTIKDFGEQWRRYDDLDEGFYVSQGLLAEITGPHLDLAQVRGGRVCEIGSGTGRIVRMLLDAGAAHAVAVEPSPAFEVLCRSLGDDVAAGRVTALNVRGDELPAGLDLDVVFSIGVLHHIPDPDPVLAAAHRALRPGGRVCVWLYGLEGNRLYLAFVTPWRAIARVAPDGLIAAISGALDVLAVAYGTACRALPLPLARYFRGYFMRLTPAQRRLVIFDQINPAYAKYYTQSEAIDLLRRAGFEAVRAHHRDGYSWTVTGTKPHPEAAP